jgi:CBS domain-containing protein
MQRVQKTISEFRYEQGIPELNARDPVMRALDLMATHRHDCVLVSDGHKVVGIFTGNDFLNRVAATHLDPAKTTLGEVMTVHPETLRRRDCVSYAINRMAVRGFRNVPIVDEDGAALGVLTVWDVMRHLGEIFDDIESSPSLVDPASDISSVTWIDTGGGG